ncbi:MAG: hypothetical protein RLZZ53_1046 [Acidobacteriota bacterium]|jgi:hypothetical protein
MGGVVDYAGLFPPAALSMTDALRAYSAALAGPDAWLLGRFVVPAARIAELVTELAAFTGPRLPLSVIVTDGSDADAATVNGLRGGEARVLVECIECKPNTVGGIDWLASAFAGCEIYAELVPSASMDEWFARLAARGVRAKLRTGGTTPGAFPSPDGVVSFMVAAMSARVPFKATAGLHHAVRGRYRLTYAPDSADAVMYGYLNVLLAAAALRAGLPAVVATRLLLEENPAAFTFTDDALHWQDVVLAASDLQSFRQAVFTGFGSCSIDEPASEIRALIAQAVTTE